MKDTKVKSKLKGNKPKRKGVKMKENNDMLAFIVHELFNVFKVI